MKVQSENIEAVIDGDIDIFINIHLRWKKQTHTLCSD